jgi:hypothetical protein
MSTKSRSVLFPIFALAGLIAATAIAYPRLAVEHGDSCKSCHINPTGAGARTEFGNYSVALNELTLPQTKEIVAKRYKRSRIGESLIFGFDMRHLLFSDGRLFRMQTDVYLTAEPFKDMFYHIRLGEHGVFENYALVTFKDEKYYLKAGRFYPTFGLHNDDHQAYVRERSGFGPLEYLDGAAIGVEQFGVNFSAEFFNQEQRGIYGLHAFRAGSVGPLGYLAGTSLRLAEEHGGSTGQFPTARALFGGLSFNRFTALGEVDLNGKHVDTVIYYGALYGRVEYGLWLVGEYNFFDGNRHVASGVDEFVRLSAEFYPIPFFELRPSLTYYTRGFRDNQHEWFLQIHFGY